MKGFTKKRKKMKKSILYICVAAVTLVVMTVTVFAEELPADTLAAGESAAQEVSAPTEEVLPAPSAGPEQTPGPSPEPAPSAPEPSVTPEPVPTEPAAPSAEPAPMPEPPAEPEAPAQESVQEPQAPPAGAEPASAPPAGKEAEKSYDAPAVFINGITAKGGNDTLQLTEEQLTEIEKMLPQDISLYRREVVMQAYSLVGKVNYFWGGKSTAAGWDVRWGNDAIVGSAGSTQTGTQRVYGLDCSGYVLWSFVNAEENLAAHDEIERMNKTDVVNRIGYGTAGQWALSTEIPRAEAQPGDIVFYGPPAETPRNHVGIIVGTDEEGRLMVAHCSSSANNVVISELEEAGFRHIRRLDLLQMRESDVKNVPAGQNVIPVMPNGLPMFLTEQQAYEGAVKNGWGIGE